MSYAASAPSAPQYLPIKDRLVLHPSHPRAFAPPHMQHLTLNLCRAKGRDVPKLNYSDTIAVGQYLLANFSVAEIETTHEYLKSEYSKRKSRGPYARKPSPKPKTWNIDILPAPESDTNVSSTTEPDTVVNEPAKPENLDLRDYVRKTAYSLGLEIIHKRIDYLNGAVNTAIDDLREELKNSKPLVIEIKRPNIPTPQNIGIQHKCFPSLVAACNAIDVDGKHLNIYIHGPAATGKSYACKQINKAIYNGKYPMRGSGQTLLPHEFMGYYHGDKYVRSQFRDAFEYGGFFFADEFDRYSPGATVALNNCLAGNEAAFPDGMVERHPDFIFIACGNTRGAGATMEYSTAQKQDAATKNRFIDIDWPIDEAIEDAMTYNKDWLILVRKVRDGVKNRQIKGVMITPRQTAYGQALISAGFTIEQAANSCLRQGMDDGQWRDIVGTLV